MCMAVVDYLVVDNDSEIFLGGRENPQMVASARMSSP